MNILYGYVYLESMENEKVKHKNIDVLSFMSYDAVKKEEIFPLHSKPSYIRKKSVEEEKKRERRKGKIQSFPKLCCRSKEQSVNFMEIANFASRFFPMTFAAQSSRTTTASRYK